MDNAVTIVVSTTNTMLMKWWQWEEVRLIRSGIVGQRGTRCDRGRPTRRVKKEMSSFCSILLRLPTWTRLVAVMIWWLIETAVLSPPSVRSAPSHVSQICREWCYAPMPCTRYWWARRLSTKPIY